ncbi:hypothetical protein FN846DRAFT_916836 [Sphaerosporella brunnea]|uniref:Alpha/Beta hydrolase protein n=1 Tax=Sphaerosporella brunnea TaxID=1250544 RepID=A0A5J5F5H7_9PEZI|nr:hypothetical protein FN846DRAFT_916836 [Sphaerosporella brunnea]
MDLPQHLRTTLIGQSAGAAAVAHHTAAGIPEASHKDIVVRVCKVLGVTGEELINTLSSAPQKELYEKLSPDLNYPPVAPLTSGSGQKLEAVMAGDCAHDGDSGFVELYTRLVPGVAKGKLWGILTDWAFFAPAAARAMESEVPTYLYHFNQLNSFSAGPAKPWIGQANHILDLAYMLRN